MIELQHYVKMEEDLLHKSIQVEKQVKAKTTTKTFISAAVAHSLSTILLLSEVDPF